MNKKKTLLVLITSLFILEVLYFFGTLPYANAAENDEIIDNYSQDFDTDLSGVWIYNVTEFGGPTNWWVFTNDGYFETSPGGQITVNFTGIFDRHPYDWGDVFPAQIPRYDLKIYNKTQTGLALNFTKNNVTNKEAGYALTLGYNDFQPGFIIPVNDVGDLKANATTQADGFAKGKVLIDDAYNFLSIYFLETDEAFDQETTLVYDKITGLLVRARTSVGEYLLDIFLTNYSIDLDHTYKYDVKDFGGATSWYNFSFDFEGKWLTNFGGRIIVDYVGKYNKDPNDLLYRDSYPNNMPRVWYDIDIQYLILGEYFGSTFDLDNISNREAATQMTLGFNGFQPGFFLLDAGDLSSIISNATSEAAPGVIYSSNGTLSIKIYNCSIELSYVQTDDTPFLQTTKLIYERDTGILLYAKTSFGDYLLEMEIEDYDPPSKTVTSISPTDDDDDDDDGDKKRRERIPSFSIVIMLSLITIMAVIMILKMRNKLK